MSETDIWNGRSRWQRSRPSDKFSRIDLWSGVVSALVTWVFTSRADRWGDVWLPLLAAVIGSLVGHFLIQRVHRYFWVVPEEVLTERTKRLQELEARFNFSAAARIGYCTWYWPTRLNERGIWVVFENVTVTNKDDAPVPVELWIEVAPNTSAKMGYKAANGNLPDWVSRDLEHTQTGDRYLDSLLNLDGRSGVNGFCFARVDESILPASRLENWKEVAEKCPVWLLIKDTISQKQERIPANHAANRAQALGAP